MPIDQMTLRPHSLPGAGLGSRPALLANRNVCATRMEHLRSTFSILAADLCQVPRRSASQKNFGVGFPEGGHFSPCLID